MSRQPPWENSFSDVPVWRFSIGVELAKPRIAAAMIAFIYIVSKYVVG
jgi:hypothetical protein